MQRTKGNPRLPIARQQQRHQQQQQQQQQPPPPPPLPPSSSSNKRLGERPKRQSVIPSTISLAEGPDYAVRQADIHQLLQFLRELGIAATEEDLSNCNNIRIRQMFELLLQYFVPHRIEFLQNLKQRVATAFEDTPELGVEHVQAIPIFKEMQRFLKKLRFTDFKLTDVLSPTPTRLQKILSALFNYSLFRDTAYDQFKSITEEAVGLTAQRESLITEKELLEEKASELESQTELERAEAQGWEVKVDEAEQVLRQLRKEGDAIAKDVESCKSERSHLTDSLQELQYKMLETLETVRELKAYETWDLDVIGKEIVELTVGMEKKSEEVNVLERDIPLLEDIILEAKYLCNNLSKWIEIMDTVNSIRGDSNRHKRTNETLKKEQLEAIAIQKDMANKVSNVSRSLAVQNRRLQLLMDQREKKRESMDQYFKDLENKKEAINQEAEAALEEKNKCDIQIKEIQDKYNAAVMEHKRSMEELTSQIQRVFDIINDAETKAMLMQEQ
ncbi:Nuf2 family-domain-containing protein [Parasitella parasitica]|nr:Nuf2 family-domain-containing protein [Parasitella parasitica]